MECLQGALKTGFGLDMAPRNLPLIDDFFGVHGVTDGDDLFVDELLDFSNDLLSSETEQEQQPPQENEPEDKNFMKTCSVEAENSELPVKDEFVPLQETELSIPEEGLESLEWLSHFVEDSFSEHSLTVENRSEPVVPVQEPPCFATPVQTKARTKRARTGVRVWPVLSPESLSATTSSTSSTSSTTTMAALFLPPKKQKKKAFDVAKEPRRCSHCGVTKTPQWRAGPFGSKTLCNACGVRFKSGRLLPEYRPACSPTFSSELHSNNHRKVLEMRRKKETGPEPAGLTEFLSEVLLN